MSIKIRPLIYKEHREDPPGPSLPPYTIRLKFKDGVTPTFSKGTGVQVSSSPNIWDLTYEFSLWNNLLANHANLLEVLGGNTTNITRMDGMFLNCTSLISVALFDTSNVTTIGDLFRNCSSLTSVPLFDTSNVNYMSGVFDSCTSLTNIPLFNTSSVTDMSWMFYECSTSLTTVPLFDTSNVSNMEGMFYNCTNVESGALALYQQASSQANPPSNHSQTFYNCGSNTQTGSAELAQIQSDWK